MPDRPVFGVSEWAAHSWNIASGCSHDCRYCYARAMAVRFGRATPESWSKEHLLPAKVARRWGRVEGRIMYPTTHDITPALLEPSVTTLRGMVEAGNDVLVVTKAHLSCVERLCTELHDWRCQVMWRITIGSLDADTLRYWEPGAPPPEERLAALAHAHRAGYRTSVSSEPMLDTHQRALYDACAPYVTDSIWFGKANRLPERMRGDDDDRERARTLIAGQSDDATRRLYASMRHLPLVRWKESIKKVVGLDVATVAGTDA